MNKVGTHLLLVYELEQVPFVLPRPDETVVALDYEVELDLKKRGIAVVPLHTLAVSIEGQREPIEQTRRTASSWYTAPEMTFFEHDGIKLGEQYEVVVLYYIQAVVYWVAILQQVFAHFGDLTSVRIFESYHYVPPTADPTGAFKERAAFDVARLLCTQKSVFFESMPAPLSLRAKGRLSTLRRSILGALVYVAVGALNAAVNLFAKPHPLIVFASDPWSRLEPFVSHMPDVELVMTRRQELRAMGLRAVVRTRARFHHRLDFVDRRIRELAHEKAQSCAQAWKVAQAGISEGFRYEGVSYWPVVGPMFDSIVNDYTEDAVATIENTKRIFGRYGVNRVLLFASTKGYNNVIARVAERMNIPSIELQHAIETVEPSFVHSRLAARYLAAYGPLARKRYETFNVEPWRIIECGSPRFDFYAAPVPDATREALKNKLQLDGPRLNVMLWIPQVYLCLGHGNFSTYSVQDTLEDYAWAQRQNPWMRYLLRPRPGPTRKSFYNRRETLDLFMGETRMAQEEDLRSLLSVSDIVVSGNSTVVLESMLAHKPVVMYLPRNIDKDFQPYEDAGAVLMARTKEELSHCMEQMADETSRTALVARADKFLEENFLLDGKSAQRVAALLRTPPNPPKS